MTNENFFKHDDKAYAENLNDAILVANAFNYQVPVNIPGMYNNNHYPNDNNIHKVGVSDVTIVTSGSLSIGDTAITNNSNTSQTLRLRIYPNFNNFYGWKDLGWDGDGGITIDICDAGTTTSLLPSGELTTPDGNNLAGIASLRGLKEYDLLITIPANGILNTLSIVFINNWNSSNRISASINQSNVTGLESDLAGLANDLDTVETRVDTIDNRIINLNTEVWGGDTQTGTSRIDALESDVTSIKDYLMRLKSFTVYINNANYTVLYNDYQVIVDIHMSRTSYPPSLSNFGADVIPADCLPSQPVTVPMQNVNAVVSIRNNSQGIWRKSNTGNAIEGVSCYCHIEYDRTPATIREEEEE